MTRFSVPMWLAALVLAGCKGCDNNPKDDTGGIDLSEIDDDRDGYTADVDCDDEDDAVHPDATEVCNGIDDDCDEMVDDADPGVDESTKDTWYTDQDDDGYGTDDSAQRACSQPYANSVIEGGDCDDDDANVNPGELEVCDGVDNDCDGTTDIGAVDGYTVYEDADGDGYGDEGSSLVVCEDTEGWTETGGDCDDDDDDVNPGETEACFNEIDDNCDGEIDDSCPLEVCGDITEDTTWEAIPFGYYVSCDIAVQAELTIEPDTMVYFAPDVGMSVGVDGAGALIVDASDAPVTFTSGVSIIYPTVAPAPGDWTGLVFGENADTYTTLLDGLLVGYGGGEDSDGGLVMSSVSLPFSNGEVCNSGSDGLVALDGAEPDVLDSVFCENEGHGFYADDDSGPANFDGNDLYGNAAYPVSVLARYGDVIEGTNTFEDHAADVAYVELRGDIVTQDITLAAQDYPYAISSDVAIYDAGAPLLTLEDGVTIAFAYEAGLQIGSTTTPGDLMVTGPAEGVTLTAMDPTRGWDGVTVQQGSDVVDLEGLTIEYGGNNGYGNLYLVNGSTGLSATIDGCTFSNSASDGLYVGPAAAPLITGSSFTDNAAYGVHVYDGSTSEGALYVLDDGASFAGNTLSGNAAPITLPANYLDQLDDTSFYTGNTSDLIEVTGSTVERTGTWRKLDADYWVLGNVAIEDSSSPIVTVDAGATFYMDPDVELSVGDGDPGGLATDGTPGTPVTFTSAAASPSPGDWDGITIGEDASSSTYLSGVVVEYGGGNGYGGVYIYIADPELSDCTVSYSGSHGVYVAGRSGGTPNPDITGCSLENNEENGLYVSTSGGLGTFEENTLTGNGAFPASVDIEYAGALDDASTYTGNGDDRVELLGDRVSDDATWAALGVPWYTEDLITVSADLSLDAGLEMEFYGASSGLKVGSTSAGSLTVNGTSGSRVTMTSGEGSPAEGDWAGLTLSAYCTASTLKYLDVTYADIGITVDCKSANSIRNSSFLDSATYDVKCTSRATATTWSSVTYDTSNGCTP